MELVGTIRNLFEAKDISASFRKRELVLTTDGRYPQQILVEFTQEKIDLLDGFSPGDQVRIQIDIRGREWKSPRGEVKYFVSVHGWRIENLAHAQAQQGPEGGYDGYPGAYSSGGSSSPPPFDDAPFPSSPDAGSAIRDDDIPF